MEDGELNSKMMSNREAVELMKQKYGCRTHGLLEKGTLCYLPPQGKYKGEHLRIGDSLQTLLSQHMVSLQLLFVLFMSFLNWFVQRNNPGFNIKADDLPSSIKSRIITSHEEYLRQRDIATHTSAAPAVAAAAQAGPVHAPNPPPNPPARPRPKLNLDLSTYPDIGETLTAMEDPKIPERKFSDYTVCFCYYIGAANVGELLHYVYEEADGQENLSAKNALIKAMADQGVSPPPILVSLMLLAFEKAAIKFEIEMAVLDA
jgi:hypothetical protein